jgi:hypothetical protein
MEWRITFENGYRCTVYADSGTKAKSIAESVYSSSLAIVEVREVDDE